MKIKITTILELLVTIFWLESCKTPSNLSGVIEDHDDNTYYFKVIDYKDVHNNDNLRYSYTLLSQEGCFICRATCQPENREEITLKNVDRICNFDVKIVNCLEIGFDQKNKIYNKDKDNLKADILVKNDKDKIVWYEYFEKLNNFFETKFEDDENGICVNKSTDIVIFDTTWEEVVENSIYKLQNDNIYFHATNKNLYKNKYEAALFCSNLKDKNLEWRLISSSEFDLANEKKIAVKLNHRMKIGLAQCFFTSDGNLKTFSDDESVQKNCQHSTQGRAICVTNK